MKFNQFEELSYKSLGHPYSRLINFFCAFAPLRFCVEYPFLYTSIRLQRNLSTTKIQRKIAKMQNRKNIPIDY